MRLVECVEAFIANSSLSFFHFDRTIIALRMQEHGHVNVAQKYSQDGQLGSWVANIRSKRKQMAKRGEEFELDIPLGGDDGEDDEDVVADGSEAGEGGKKRKRGGNGRQRLTRDRIVSIIVPSYHVNSNM